MINDIVINTLSNIVVDIIYTPAPIDGQILDDDVISDDYIIQDETIMGG